MLSSAVLAVLFTIYEVYAMKEPKPRSICVRVRVLLCMYVCVHNVNV